MHDHPHEHMHEHEHTHADGTTHVHAHVHEHSHEHEHTHAHEHEHLHAPGEPHTHEHDHTHSHEHHHDASVTPREELLAMLKYMVGHNAAHVRETKELAEQVRHENPAAYDKIIRAVEDFERGNAMLDEALQDLK